MKTMMATALVISSCFLLSNASASLTDFCSIETRTCRSALWDRPVRCGYKKALAFVNCGKDDAYKLDAKSAKALNGKIEADMNRRNMKFIGKLNEKDIYTTKNSGPSDTICHAQLKYTQIASTFFTSQYNRIDGYVVDCIDSGILDRLTLGEVRSFSIQGKEHEVDLNKLEEKLVRSLGRLDYEMVQELPMNLNEYNNFPFTASGPMFENGDHRFSEIIFQKY